jgi:hypothetical protein
MKTKNILVTIIAAATLAVVAGCNQNPGTNSNMMSTNAPSDMTNSSTGGQNLPPANPVMPATNSVGTNSNP